jgi:hypothetical protein
MTPEPRYEAVGALPLDDVVDLSDLRLAGVLEGDVGEETHYPLPESLEVLLRIPDLIHEELPLWPGCDTGPQRGRPGVVSSSSLIKRLSRSS